MTLTAARDRSASSRQALVGILWMLLCGLLFLAVTGIVRHLGTDLPAVQSAFLRYAFGVVLILPVIYRARHALPRGVMLGTYVIRGLLHGGAVILWFFAMARIPIAEVTALGYMTPIFITIGAFAFLGERIHVPRLMAVVAGFIGVLVVLRPGFQDVSIGSLAQLSAAPLFAASYLIAKRLTLSEAPMMIVAMLSIFCTLVLLPGAMYVWRPPTIEEFGWLFLTAAFATAGHYTLTRALQAAPVTVTQPVTFLQLVWAVILGMVVFGEAIDPYVIVGAAIIIAATTYIAHREVIAARRARAAVRAP